MGRGASVDEKYTLYIDGMVVFNNLRYNGEGESVFHLMSQEHVL
jgi:hypothetical protein